MEQHRWNYRDAGRPPTLPPWRRRHQSSRSNGRSSVLSGAEAARILGVHELSVARLVRQGVLHKPVKRQQYALDHTEVEAYALQRWKPGHAYWLSSQEAAEILGLTSSRVSQLARAGKIPAVRYGRRWFYRRHQIEVVANAREARELAGTGLGRGMVRRDRQALSGWPGP